MIEKINLNNILFLDIETVPEYHNYRGLDNETQQLWEQKTQYQRKDEVSADKLTELKGQLTKITGVTKVGFTSKEQERIFNKIY